MIFQQLAALVKRDFRLLARSKSSSAVILLGPLLVILVVGVVFSGAGGSDARIGVVSGGFEDASLYEDRLAESFVLSSYDDVSGCVSAVQRGVVVACVEFGSSARTASLHVDPTDVSIVYLIIDQVTGVLDEQSGELRSGLTQTLLSVVSDASSVVGSQEESLSSVVEELEGFAAELADVRSGIGELVVESDLDAGGAGSTVEDVFDSYDVFVSIADSASDGYLRLAERHNDSVAGADALRDDFLNESVVNDSVFEELLSSLDSLDSSLADAATRSSSLSGDVSFLRDELLVEVDELSLVIASLEGVRSDLSVDISAQDITSPLDTEVVPVAADEGSFANWLPQFLVLLVMFTAILLASLLVVGERGSRAYFRNFTTPTRDWVFVLSTYFTTVAVLFLQLLLLFLVVSLFSSVSVLDNFLSNFSVLLVVVSFFAFLGMVIGYLFKTREGVMLSAITACSALMLVSGLVLPVQTLPELVQFFVSANPFVISSDLLTGTLIHGFSVGSVWWSAVVLGLYSIMLFAVIMLTQRAARVNYFESRKTAFHVSAFLGEQEVPEGKELRVGERVVGSKQDLLVVLRELSDEEYEQFADHQRNLFANWVRDVYKDDRLSRLLRNKSRKGAIAVLEKELS